tara:strand:- start:16200 stop:16634 length:435 start_codon:yes stop_codon:yes gene_type:complete
MVSDWLYKGEKFVTPEDFTSDDWMGFVYIITNNVSNRKYVGKKLFFFKKTLPVTKKRKRRKRVLYESDWEKYWGSNKHLMEEVETANKDEYTREILHLCKTRGELSYMELVEQVERKVLLSDDFYNGIIQIRIGSRSLKDLQEK